MILRLMESMGDRIRQLREAKGWSQEDLAIRLTALLKSYGQPGISSAAVSLWETDQTKNIKNLTFYLLTDELGTTAEYLLFGPRGPKDRAASGKFGRRPRGARNENTG